MIINLSKIKTEALLLFCQDIITTYKDSDENIFDIDEDTVRFISVTSQNMLNEINRALKPRSYYINNANTVKVKAVLKSYEFLNKEISKELKTDTPFNPSMLCFSLLATWFAELGKESKTKEYLYFSLFIYGDVYDKLLINQKNTNFKALNISMINIAEQIIYRYESFKSF